MFHFTAPGRYLAQRSPAIEWGRFTHFIEVADDREASRQVDVFKNGYVLRYDRSHRRDAYAYLMGLRFSRKPKWKHYFPGVELISTAEFEDVWGLALASPFWEQQLAESL